MEKKILFGTLGGALAGLIASTVIFMGLFGGMAEQWMADNAACLKEMNPAWWPASALAQGLLYALLLHKMGVSTWKGGAMAGAWISLLLFLFIGIAMASTYTAYPWPWLPYDVVGNAIAGAAGGAAIGWIFGKVK